MNARARRSLRRNKIVAVCNELREDSLTTGHGLDIQNFENESLYEIVQDLTGFEFLSDPEKRLAVVAFEEGAGIAKASIWYK